MKRVTSFLLLLAAGCATSSNREFRNGEIAVLGTVKNHNSETLDDFGLDNLFTAEVHVKRVLSGKISSEILKIRYIAHNPLSEGKITRLRLRLAETGEYLVCKEGRSGYVCP